jgi:hypothetical protein
MLEAWSAAIEEGHDPDLLANAALFTALSDLVSAYGEDEVKRFASTLPGRIERGEFTANKALGIRH